MLAALYSPKGTYDSTFLANYAYINMADELTRVPGVAKVNVFGAGQYATRIWVKPNRLASLGLTIPQIVGAVQNPEHREPGGADRRRTSATGAGIHL